MMSLTHMATRSMPMVSWRSMRMAILILVPTPSVAETSTGSRYFCHAQVEQAPESADLPQDAGAVGGFYQGPDDLDKGVGLIDVDPGLLIGTACGHPLVLPLQSYVGAST